MFRVPQNIYSQAELPAALCALQLDEMIVIACGISALIVRIFSFVPNASSKSTCTEHAFHWVNAALFSWHYVV
eukprot:m.289681 g.289681  ORF g.289681 m.289681 type:complete len:73 (+) comp27112_c0_seq3:2935-3153(+)